MCESIIIVQGAVSVCGEAFLVASFLFKVIDERDQVVSGTLSAPNAQAAQERLRAVYKNVLVVEEQKSSGSLNALKRSPRVKVDSLAVYCRQLAVMVNAGIAINRALRFCSRGEDQNLNLVMNRVAEEVEGGKSVSQALGEQPRVFGNIFIALVKAGESSGNLDIALKKLADLLEKVVGMQKKVQSTLAYPAVIFVVAVCVVAFFTFYIMPQMIPIFESMNTELPLPTRIMMFIANTLRNPWISGSLAICAVAGSIMAFNVYQNLDKAPEVRYYIDQYILRIPVLGQLFRLATQARVMFTMATLLDSGVSLAETLLVVEKVADNEVYSRRIKWAREGLLQGASVYAAFESHEVFNPMALHMIKVGEETGTLAEMVRRIGMMYEEDVEHQLDQLSSLIEPLIMAVMGLVVGFITVASFLPMVQLLNQL
jgi:type IV pilus assembly protein PilC